MEQLLVNAIELIFKLYFRSFCNICCCCCWCIGTDAWIDALGYLRQKDYIADKDGYRILKSKTVFVGKSRPIKVSFAASFSDT